MMYKSIKSMVETLKSELQNSAQSVVKYLELLFRLQTDSEQIDSVLRTKNNVGFTRNDSKRLTFLAQQARVSSLSADQIEFLHKVLPKYAPQIVKVLLSDYTIEKLKRGCYIW